MTFSTRAAVSLAIVIFMTTFLVVAQDYSAKARLLPTIITSLVLVMALIQLSAELFPAIARRLTFLEQQSLLVNDRTRATVEAQEIDNTDQDDGVASQPSALPEQFAIPLSIVAMAGLLVMLRYLPYWVAVPVFLAIMLIGLGRQKVMISLALSIGTGAALYVLFGLILSSRI